MTTWLKILKFSYFILILFISSFYGKVSGSAHSSTESLISKNMKIHAIYQPTFGLKVGTVSLVQGLAIVYHEKSDVGYHVKKNIPLYYKDTIITSESSRIQIFLNNGSIINMASNTKLTLFNYIADSSNNTATSYLTVYSGKIRTKFSNNNNFKYQITMLKTNTVVVKAFPSDFLINTNMEQTEIISLSYANMQISPIETPNNIKTIDSSYMQIIVQSNQLIKYISLPYDIMTINNLINKCMPLPLKKFQTNHQEKYNAKQVTLSDISVEKKSNGYQLLQSGKIDDAVVALESVLKKEPGDPYSILYLGLAYLYQKKFEKALNIWQKFRDKKQPYVEQEIQRELTLLQYKVSYQIAEKALNKEINLGKPAQNTIAVCYYEDLSPNKTLRPFQKAMTLMLISNLSKIKNLQVVERLQLQALLDELRLSKSHIVDKNNSIRIGYLLGAENLVVGTLVSGSIRVTTCLTSVSEQNVISTMSDTVDRDQFFKLPMIITLRIVSILSLDLSQDDIKSISEPQTKIYEAFVDFSRGLDAMDSGNWKMSRYYFNRALQADPNFSMAKTKRDSCPLPSTPNIESIKRMTPSQFIKLVGNAVIKSIVQQREMDGYISYEKENEIKEIKELMKDQSEEKFEEDTINIIETHQENETKIIPGISNFPKPPEF